MDTEEIMDVLLHELETDPASQWNQSKDFFEKEFKSFAEHVAETFDLFEKKKIDFKEGKKNIEKMRPELEDILTQAKKEGLIAEDFLGEKFVLKSISILVQLLE
jgi:hypothetical protein